MNITVTDQPQCRKQLRVEIPADEVRAEADLVISKLAQRIRLPGFRPGRVPKSVIKSRFQKEVRDEVLQKLLPRVLGEAIEDRNLKLVGQPALDELKLGSDDSIDATFTIEVAPEFQLSNYKGLPVTHSVFKVSDEDIESAIDRLREQQAELVPVEDRPAGSGDIVTVNLQSLVSSPEGSSSEAGQVSEEAQEVEITLNEETLEEFRTALSGAVPGDHRQFRVRYPTDYPTARLAGRQVDYSAEVIAVRTKELPDVDDEFAQAVSADYKTAAQLREAVRKDLEITAQRRTRDALETSALEMLIDRNRFEVPDYVVDKQIDSRMKSLIRQMSGQGLDPRKLKVDWEALREANRPRAEREVRAGFILDRIAQIEGIEVGDEELELELERLAAVAGQTRAALKARLTKEKALDSIKEQVRNRKALEFVIASADIRTVEVEGLGRDEENIRRQGRSGQD